MKLQPNQIQVTMGEKSRTYTFDQHGHCDVTDETGELIAFGISDIGRSSVYLDVVERGYTIDERNLDVFMGESPDLGQKLQLHLYKTGVEA